VNRIKNPRWFYDESGGALSFVVILILSMTLLATASMTLAKTQLTVSRFGEQSSNSYHLARSGAEKLVDTMNKEIAMELPRLMEEANNKVHEKLLAEGKEIDGVTYQYDGDLYSGRYVGRDNENEYKVELKKRIYNYIVQEFVTGNRAKSSYEVFLGIKNNISIQMTTTIYSNQSKKTKTIPGDMTTIVGQLATENDIGTNPDNKDAFVIEVTAQAREGTKASLAKSRVVGTIALEELLKDDQLLEEYEWATNTSGKRMTYPEALQAAVISFGDFVIQGKNKVTIDGDVHVRGTQRKSSGGLSGNVPEPDQWGGIIVSDGGALKITDGSAFVVSNIQTVNSFGKEDQSSTINIAKDAIANTISINDSYYSKMLPEEHPNKTPWDNLSSNNVISITRNAYVDDDIRIDRYVINGKIQVNGSAFGISDGDKEGKAVVVDGVRRTIVDPNKSSGIFSLGKNSIISLGRAFIGGQAFIDFGDGNGYHRLHESGGEPFQEVYYLDKYREKYEDDETYMIEFEDIINTNKITIIDRNGENPAAFAPAYISENGGVGGKSSKMTSGYGFVSSQEEARKLFYAGYGENVGLPAIGWENTLATESEWTEDIPGTTLKWGDLVLDPLGFYQSDNPYKKQYLPLGTDSFVYASAKEYKGLQAYMLAKRGVFYKGLEEVTSNQYKPVERKFEDFIDLSVFGTGDHPWSYNDPIYMISTSDEIDISDFSEIPTAIVCKDPNTIIKLKGSGIFNGIIMTPGKVEIINDMTINGSIIVGNEYQGEPSREDIQSGKYAGVQILADNVKVNYDEDMLLKIRFMDKSLQRKLYDSLKITSYQAATLIGENANKEQEKIDAIMGKKDHRIIQLSPTSVISSEQGGLKFVMRSLGKL